MSHSATFTDIKLKFDALVDESLLMHSLPHGIKTHKDKYTVYTCFLHTLTRFVSSYRGVQVCLREGCGAVILTRVKVTNYLYSNEPANTMCLQQQIKVSVPPRDQGSYVSSQNKIINCNKPTQEKPSHRDRFCLLRRSFELHQGSDGIRWLHGL